MQQTLSDLIAELPSGILPRINRGFLVFSDLAESAQRDAVEKFLQSFEQSSTLEDDWLAEVTSISSADALALLTALSVAVGLLSQTSVSATEFVEAGRGILFGEGQVSAASAAARLVIEERPRLQKTIKNRALSAETMPSLERFDVSIDLRLSFGRENQILAGVPVAIVHIDTDAEPELFLQMSKGDVEMVVGKLRRVLDRMNEAEKVFAKTLPGVFS
jgi:hypothetical protein